MKTCFFFIFLIFLTGCNLEPRYRRPSLDLPQCWKEKSDDGDEFANLRWWEALDDPILNALVLKALNNNKDLQVAAWRVCEFYGQYLEIRSALFPQLSLEATALKERFPQNGSFLPVGFNPITPFYSYDFVLSYEVDLWGQYQSATHAAFEQLLAQVENRRTVVLTLVSSVAHAYVYLRQLDMQLAISRQTLKSREESLQIAIYRFEGGLTSKIDVDQAAATYEETLATVKNLERQVPQQENLISVLIGENPSYILRGKEVDQFLLPPCVPAGLPSDLLERRPDIIKSENLLIAANAQIGVARAAFFPQITLTGLFGGASFQLNTLFSKTSRTWQIGGSLLQPLFTGGQLIGQYIAAEAELKQACFQYQQVILTALKEVNDALIGHEKSKEIVIVEQKRVEALKEYLHLAWLRYYEGETQYLTVLDAERHLFAAELDLATAFGNVFFTLIDLYKSLGGGWVIDADCTLRS